VTASLGAGDKAGSDANFIKAAFHRNALQFKFVIAGPRSPAREGGRTLAGKLCAPQIGINLLCLNGFIRSFVIRISSLTNYLDFAQHDN